MDSYNAVAVAEILGVSPPSVHRLCARLKLDGARAKGEHRSFTVGEIARMEAVVGAVPARPAGLSREYTLALAVLTRHPRGVVSARAVARAAGISQSTASKALAELAARGLAVQEPRRVIDPVPRDINFWFPNVCHPDWPRIAEVLGQVRLPRGTATQHRTGVPRHLWYLFWNGDPRRLDVVADADYIASRLLLSDDPGAFEWAATHLPRKALAGVARLRGASPRQRALAINLATEGAEA